MGLQYQKNWLYITEVLCDISDKLFVQNNEVSGLDGCREVELNASITSA